jgi:hypothetical protein
MDFRLCLFDVGLVLFGKVVMFLFFCVYMTYSELWVLGFGLILLLYNVVSCKTRKYFLILKIKSLLQHGINF